MKLLIVIKLNFNDFMTNLTYTHTYTTLGFEFELKNQKKT